MSTIHITYQHPIFGKVTDAYTIVSMSDEQLLIQDGLNRRTLITSAELKQMRHVIQESPKSILSLVKGAF